MGENNPGYHLPSSTQPSYLPPYNLNLRYVRRDQGGGVSSDVKSNDNTEMPPHPGSMPHYPPMAYNPHCLNFAPGTSALGAGANLNHNENCNRNRALSLPSGYGLPLCPSVAPVPLPIHVLAMQHGHANPVFNKSRRKSSADVLYEPVLPIYPTRNIEYPTYIPTILPPAYNAVDQNRHLSCNASQYLHYQDNVRRNYERRRSMPFDSNPPVYIPPSSDDTDDVFVCETAPPPPVIRQRRKRIHSVENIVQDNAACQETKKLKETHNPPLSLSQKHTQSLIARKEVIGLSPKVKSQKTPSKSVVKKVAWEDDEVTPAEKNEEKINDSSSSNDNFCGADYSVFLSTLKSDRLVEKNYDVIKADPNAFTIKNKIGCYFVGPRLEASPVKSIRQFLVRKEDTFDYYMAKVLVVDDKSPEGQSGRTLLQSEHRMLCLVQDNPGVVHHHGLYKDSAYDVKTDSFLPRLTLILDCVTPHDYDDMSREFLNLQQHVIKEKHLNEKETILLFRSVVAVVDSLHKINIVHRDLKLGNMILNRRNNQVLLTNFCLGRQLKHSNELLKDKRGSPAYISPDVLSGKPYAGKPSDMWSLGVLLFTMLYGHFPFYDQEPKKLFQRIQKGVYAIPSTSRITSNINDIIRGLLTLDPVRRLTSSETHCALESCYAAMTVNSISRNLQVVPEFVETDKSSEDEDETEYNQKVTLARQTEEFQKKMLGLKEDPPVFDGEYTRPITQQIPPIRHISIDARPLTMHELYLHRQIVGSAQHNS